MRTEPEVARFRDLALQRWSEVEAEYYTACFDACVPRTFWDVSAKDVKHNREVFDNVVRKYCAKRKKAQRHGWSLLLFGDNGVGKTMFLSFVLTQMLKRGCGAYYTSLAQLDVDIKRGFNDPMAEARMAELVTSDFLAIDELGKEHFRQDSYLNTRLELILKTRHDEGDPTLLATNLDYDALVEMYGPSVQSMLEGKYHTAQLESGDFRKSISTRMRKDMGL